MIRWRKTLWDLSGETPEEINLALAQRLSRIRKRRKLTQEQLSEKSNVSYGSIKRFETSGQISLLFPHQALRSPGAARTRSNAYLRR